MAILKKIKFPGMQEAAQIACEEMFIIAVQAMKDTFKNDISTEQMEYFLKSNNKMIL